MKQNKLTTHPVSPINSSVQLGPRAKQVLAYVFEHPDHTQAEIARVFGITPRRVYAIVHHKRFLAALPEMAKIKVRQMVPKAARRFGELMEQTENLEVSRKVTERVLDTSKVLEPEIKVNINLYETMPIDELKQIINQTKELPDNVVDTEIVEEE